MKISVRDNDIPLLKCVLEQQVGDVSDIVLRESNSILTLATSVGKC